MRAANLRAALADLLARLGHIEELRVRADTGDTHAAIALAGVLANEGNTDDALNLLRTRADAGQMPDTKLMPDAGQMPAAIALASLLAHLGRLDDLRARRRWRLARGRPIDRRTCPARQR